MKIVHIYYYDPKFLDLAKLREQAVEISTGDYRTAARPVVLHYHSARENCGDQTHEHYSNKEVLA